MSQSPTVPPGLAPFWFFNDASTLDEKMDYLHRCHAGGIGQLAMHCRSGNGIPYASAEWFAMIRALVQEGGRLGMRMWLYDEDPYPSGGAGGLVMAERPDLRARAMDRRLAPTELQPGELWYIGRERVLWAGLLPTTAATAASPIDRTADVGMVRRDWFMGEWDSRYYYNDTQYYQCPRGDAVNQHYAMRVPEVPEGYAMGALVETFPGSEGSWNSLPDLLNPESFGEFRRLVLDRYDATVGEWYGTTIPGIFTDEPKYFGCVPLTGDLAAAFEARYGYALDGRWHQLFGDALGEDWERLRVDFKRFVGERFVDAFMHPYREWAEARGLLFVGHISPEDDPWSEALFVSSVMPIMRAQGCPGCDIIVPDVGHRDAPTLNLGSLRAGSIRAQTGKPYAISETLALCPWSVTTAHARQLLTWQTVLGIDRFFPHGFFTSTEGVSLYEAPPDYGPNSSIFPGIGTLDAWMRELETVFDGATDTVEVAVLNSMPSWWTMATGVDYEPFFALQRDLWQLLLSCLQAQVGIHLVDEGDLALATTADGTLQVGRCRYRTVLAPRYTVVEATSLAALRDASAAGVRVVWFGDGPSRVTDPARGLLPAGALPGTVLPAAAPDVAWCRAELPAHATLGGEALDVEGCYLRRARATDGATYLLAVNVEPRDLALTLAPPADGTWTPVRVDGELSASDAASATASATAAWRLPARGAGLFRLDLASAAPAESPAIATPPAERARVAITAAPTFRRLEPNVLRLDTPHATSRLGIDAQMDYPRPYHWLTDRYRSKREYQAYLGPIPLDSIADDTLTYTWPFDLAAPLSGIALVLDPRFARGRFTALLDGAPVPGGSDLRYPRADTQTLHLPLGDLAAGAHSLALVFQIGHAMEGMLARVNLLGDFDVHLPADAAPVLSTATHRDDRAGWQAAGLPHYMGTGTYTWTAPLPADTSPDGWWLELDAVSDSATLTVNGVALPRLAWSPWRWQLPPLAAENSFTLTVHSTAGNRFELRYPAHPEGWIGTAHLVQRA